MFLLFIPLPCMGLKKNGEKKNTLIEQDRSIIVSASKRKPRSRYDVRTRTPLVRNSI